MAQLRYIGSVDKTLIDVAALTNGKVFEIDDATAARLLNAFPNEYETVDGTSVKTKAPQKEEATTPPPANTSPEDNASKSTNEDSADATVESPTT
jgi:hypothetical protein